MLGSVTIGCVANIEVAVCSGNGVVADCEFDNGASHNTAKVVLCRDDQV